MKRREFIGLIGWAAAWPLVARAQQPERVRRIGVLLDLAEDDAEMKPRLAAFRQGLERRGWSERRNIRIDIRSAAGNADQHQPLAKELLALQPEVILAHTTRVTKALQQESREVPIVFVTVSDPIGSGFIASLARPGGNLTGMMLYEEGIAGKWLAILKEISPRLVRVALIGNPKTTPYSYFMQSAEATARSLAIDLVPSHVETADDIARAIVALAQMPDAGLVLPPDSTISRHRDLIIELAARHRLPAVYTSRFFVEAGGLTSYGTDQVDMFRRVASYVDRILHGDNPADLPVQAPTNYESAINLKTANKLGLVIPPGLLVAADEVIE